MTASDPWPGLHVIWYPLYDQPVNVRLSREQLQCVQDALLGKPEPVAGWNQHFAGEVERVLRESLNDSAPASSPAEQNDETARVPRARLDAANQRADVWLTRTQDLIGYFEEALDVLAHIVSQANVNPVMAEDKSGEYIGRYDMPVGSIHKAIPFLARHGIVVDQYGAIHKSPSIHPVSHQNDETEPIDVLKFGVDSYHDDYGVGYFFTADAIESLIETVRSSPAATTREWGVLTPDSEYVPCADEGHARDGIARFGGSLVHRTPAGPWSPVPKEGETP